jgi:hypothetical protein
MNGPRKLSASPDASAGVTLTLTPDLIEAAHATARGRMIANRSDGRVSRVIGGTADFETHLIGAVCEHAVMAVERTPLDCLVKHGSGFRAATASDIDDLEIKGTIRPRGRLLVPGTRVFAHKRNKLLRYLLVRWLRDRNAVQIVGWQLGAVFLRPEYLDTTLPGKSYVAPWLWEYGR